jgi:hypothetical protein
MSNDNFKRQVIHHIAEQAVPIEYDPWNTVKAQLEKKHGDRKGIQQSKIAFPLKFNLNKQLVGTLGLLFTLLVVAGFFLTPQGRVAAQNLVLLFSKAKNDVLPLPSGLPTEPIHSTRTSVPTQIVGLQTVPTGEPSSFFTPTPRAKTGQGTTKYGLTIPEAEELAQFSVRTPPSLPTGYRLAEVLFDSQTKIVQQIYKYFPYQSGEMFVLSQDPAQSTETIGQSAQITQIPLEEHNVETVNGDWFTADGSNLVEWSNNGPTHTFRWQQDGLTFTLRFMVGDTFSPAYLTNDDMKAIVETVIGTQSAFPENIDLNNLANVEELKKVSSFSVLTPTLLPDGFILERAVYEPDTKRSILIYRPEDTGDSMNHPSLIIFEMPKQQEVPSSISREDWPPEAFEQVTIGPFSGTLTQGAMVNGVYDPSMGLSLHWETNDLSITINYSYSSDHPSQLQKADLTRIAEGLQ